MTEDIFDLDELCEEWREELLNTFCLIYEEMTNSEYDLAREIVRTMIIPLLNEIEWLIGEGEVNITYAKNTQSFMIKFTLTDYAVKVTCIEGHDHFFTVFELNPVKIIKNGFANIDTITELIKTLI